MIAITFCNVCFKYLLINLLIIWAKCLHQKKITSRNLLRFAIWVNVHIWMNGSLGVNAASLVEMGPDFDDVTAWEIFRVPKKRF